MRTGLAAIGGVIGIDAAGRINLANRSAGSLLSTDLDQQIGVEIGDVVPELSEMIADAQARPNRLVEDQVSIQREGRPRTLLVRLAADVVDDNIVGFVITFDDITELVAAQRKAAWSDVARRIAHEIKNPLNFVTNFAELTADLAEELAEEVSSLDIPIPEDIRSNMDELLQDIQQNSRKIDEHGKRADSIVKSMLLHSRGKKDERQTTDLNALLDEYVQLSYHGMRAQDSTFNIELDVHLSPDVPALEVVPQDLSRVFLNILNNFHG